MNLRNVMKGAALSGVVLVGGGAAGWRASRAGLASADDTPFEPWAALADAKPGDPIGLAAAAILASSPHNTQPWHVFASPDRLVIEADTERHRGAFDPYRREMWIGLGAAVANAEVAAFALGFTPKPVFVEPLGPNGAGRITLALEPSEPSSSPLFEALPKRRTNRAPYAEGPVPDAVMQRVLVLTGPVDGARLELIDRQSVAGQAFAQGAIEATRAINADSDMSQDGHAWFRANKREVARHRDGVSILTAGLSPIMSTLGQLMPKPDAAASGRYWLASTERQVAACAGYGLILVDDLDDRAGQVAAGRLWQRFHLALTAEGLAGHPLNQLPEIVDRDRQLGRDNGWAERLSQMSQDSGKATFAFRFGASTRDVPHSARRPLDWVAV